MSKLDAASADTTSVGTRITPFIASDKALIDVHSWQPAISSNAAIRGVVLLIHGMAEHAARYQRLGVALANAGIALYAPDLRGHGRTATNQPLGHFADSNGWVRVLADVTELHAYILQRHPHAPIVLKGHSMGSFIAQAYFAQLPAATSTKPSFAGLIMSGSTLNQPVLLALAQAVAGFERKRQGALGRSAVIDYLSFGAFNNAFKPSRTAYDWLSRDAAEVDAYVADALCGFRCTNQLWLDLLGGLRDLGKLDASQSLHKNVPLWLLGGEFDPVAKGGGLHRLANRYMNAGFSAVDMTVYPGGRHEMLNETNRELVLADVVNWVNKRVK